MQKGSISFYALMKRKKKLLSTTGFNNLMQITCNTYPFNIHQELSVLKTLCIA